MVFPFILVWYVLLILILYHSDGKRVWDSMLVFKTLYVFMYMYVYALEALWDAGISNEGQYEYMLAIA